MSKKTLLVKDMSSTLKATLDHFIDPIYRWPTRVIAAEAKEIQKHLPFLKVEKLKGGNDKYWQFIGKEKQLRNYSVCLTTKGIPTDILAQYWEMRYKEENDRYEALYRQIKQIADEA